MLEQFQITIEIRTRQNCLQKQKFHWNLKIKSCMCCCLINVQVGIFKIILPSSAISENNSSLLLNVAGRKRVTIYLIQDKK